MTDRATAIAKVEGWLQTAASVSRDDVRQLLVDIGYLEETAADYRSVWLYYREGWPRVTLMSTIPELPVGYLHRLCNTLLPYLQREHSA